MRIPAILEKQFIQTAFGGRLRDFNEVQRDLATGEEVRLPSDDPLRFVRARTFRSEIRKIEQFDRNATDAVRFIENAEGALDTITQDLQRIRTLALEAANETLTTSDMRQVALEVNGILEDLVVVANTKTDNGYVFAGADTQTEPFEVERDANGRIQRVVFRGDTTPIEREIDEGLKVVVNMIGPQVFRATPHVLESGYANADPTVPLASATPPITSATTSEIRIQGVSISYDLTQDSLNALATKINEANAQFGTGVAAEVVTSGGVSRLRLTTVGNDQIAIEDAPGGGLARELDLVDGAAPVYANYAGAATNTDRTIFEIVADVRDAMERGDHAALRGALLDDLDAARENVLAHRATFGGRSRQIRSTRERLAEVKLTAERLVAEATDLDFSKAITDLRRAELGLQAASEAGRNLPQPGILRLFG